MDTSYTYDTLSGLLGVLGGYLPGSAGYTYDAAGNRTSKTAVQQADPNPVSVTSNYSYDNIYQLTQAVVGGNLAEGYAYDPVGNRLTSAGPTSYNYNASNQLTSTSAATYTYDNNGNTLSKTDTNGTTYQDYENRLASVTLPGTGGTVYFNYDPMGRRIRKVYGGATTIYAYDGDNVIEDLDSSGSLVARYTQGAGIDEPLAMYRGLTTSYFHADGLGSITSLTNGSGQLAASYVYDSFGKLTASTGTLTNPFQYTGREFDAETGLYYYKARYYDIATGRFLSEDPQRFNENVNFYSYVENDPIDNTDPDGERTRVCCRLLRDLGKITLQRHCYITVDTGDGRSYTFGLHVEKKIGGVPRGGQDNLPVGAPGPRPDPTDKVKHPDKQCKDVPDATPCKEKYLIDNALSTANCRGCGLNYRTLGPNSNTYVSDTLKESGMTPPPESRAPGYDKR